MERKYKKSIKKFGELSKGFQEFAQSKKLIDNPNFNQLRDIYKNFKKERESDLEEFKKLSTEYESLTGKTESSSLSSRELSQASNNLDVSLC